MHEHLRKRDQVREITREVLQTFGSLQPKLEHLSTTPLPDKSSLIQIVGDLLEVIYPGYFGRRSEEHTSELQSLAYLVCRLLLEKKKKSTDYLVSARNT